MTNLFEQFILQEAVPRKASQLGMVPEDPPDLNNFDPNKEPEQQAPNNQQQNADPAEMNPPADLDPNAGSPEGDPNANPAADAGADPAGGEDQNGEQDPTQADPDPNDADTMGDAQAQDQPGAELDQADQDLFKDLKPEQIKIRDTELKERFQDLYTIIGDTLEKLNKVTKTSYDARMLELCLRQMINLKDLVFVALTKSFATKTYLENKIELNKLATIFNQLTNTIGTIYNARVKRTLKYNRKHNPVGSSGFNTDFTQDLSF